MSNEIQPISQQETDLLKIAQLNTMNINGLSQQMGLVNARVDALSQDVDQIRIDVNGIKASKTINRAQCRRIRKSVIGRVNDVLKIRLEGGRVADDSVSNDVLYRGGFIARLYADAKAHSKMGESYTETLESDFDEVLEYINAWVPEVDGGTDGYKRYLDIRREERQKQGA